jgi:hypothetical protein
MTKPEDQPRGDESFTDLLRQMKRNKRRFVAVGRTILTGNLPYSPRRTMWFKFADGIGEAIGLAREHQMTTSDPTNTYQLLRGKLVKIPPGGKRRHAPKKPAKKKRTTKGAGLIKAATALRLG